jgi:outer membrane biosynthesis protein TonB
MWPASERSVSPGRMISKTNAMLLLTLLGAGCAHSGHPSGDVASSPGPSAGDASPPADAAPAPVGASDAAQAPVVAAPSASTAPPPVQPTLEVTAPSYPAATLRDVFEKNAAKLRACFEPGRKRDPKLRGRVIVKFTINHDGHAGAVQDQGSNLEDPAVVACVLRTVKGLRYTVPEEGSVTVVYPFIFHPTDPVLILPDTAVPK